MATQYSNVVWSEITTILTQVNNARTKHGLAAASLTATVIANAAEFNSLLTYLMEANNQIVGTRPVIDISAAVAGDTIIYASTLTNFYNKAVEVYNTCTCNAACSCNCARCSCDCDYCTCNCDRCSCDCNYCTCNCDRCSCDCAYCTCNCYNCPQCPQCPQASTIRYKEDVVEYEFDYEALMHLPVVEFKYKEEYTTDRGLQYGTIAEWALDLGLPEFIVYEEDGKVGGFKYDRLPIALLQLIQKQDKRIREYEERLSRLEKLLQ